MCMCSVHFCGQLAPTSHAYEWLMGTIYVTGNDLSHKSCHSWPALLHLLWRDHGGMSLSTETFDPYLVPRWAWQEVKGEAAMAVNWGWLHICADCGAQGEATNVWCGCGCEEVVLLCLHRKWGEFLCGWCCGIAVKELCAFWPCGSCVFFVGSFVGFLWPVIMHLIGNRGPWGTGWCCCGAPPFRLSFRSFLLALTATPLWHRWAWLDNMNLTDAFDVV